jgi:hypothetical protein
MTSASDTVGHLLALMAHPNHDLELAQALNAQANPGSFNNLGLFRAAGMPFATSSIAGLGAAEVCSS